MSEQSYQDGDFVYVDPDKRVVVARVEWIKEGLPKRLERPDKRPEKEEGDSERKGKPRRKRYYPWGTYHTMKKLYKLEGKVLKDTDEYITLSDAIVKLMKEPFWD